MDIYYNPNPYAAYSAEYGQTEGEGEGKRWEAWITQREAQIISHVMQDEHEFIRENRDRILAGRDKVPHEFAMDYEGLVNSAFSKIEEFCEQTGELVSIAVGAVVIAERPGISAVRTQAEPQVPIEEIEARIKSINEISRSIIGDMTRLNAITGAVKEEMRMEANLIEIADFYRLIIYDYLDAYGILSVKKI